MTNRKEGELVLNGKNLAVKYLNKKGEPTSSNLSNNIANLDKLKTLVGKKCRFELSGQVNLVEIDGEEFSVPTMSKPKIQINNFGIGQSSNKNTQGSSKNISNVSQIPEVKQYIPKDTKANLSSIDNFSLRLNKFAYFMPHSKNVIKAIFYGSSDDKGDKNKYTLDLGINTKILDYVTKKQESFFKNLKLIYQNNVKDLKFKTQNKFILGLGSESVYETSITLHHIYGIPYIPSSSLKGLVRNYVIMTKYDNNEKQALKNKEFCDIFGSDKEGFDKEQRGDIIFYDALPISNLKLEVDIMNPHYKYESNVNAVDSEKTTPIPFLTVSNDTVFRVFIISRTNNNNLLDKITQILKEAVEFQGIGAKTSVGYGQMSVI